MTKDEALKLALEALEWSYGGEPMPTKELAAIGAIRQALDEWTPDDTAYRPDGLSMPVDRGAWSDVENATKWVDELRGDDKQCSSCGGFCGEVCEREDVEPIGEIIEAHGLIAVSIPKMPPVGTKLYAAPYKLWVSLSDGEIAQAVGSPLDEVYLADFRKVEAKLKEKNT